MAFKNWRNVQITAKDGTATPLAHTFTYDSALGLTIPGVEEFILKDRGALATDPEIVPGAEGEMTGSFQALPERLFEAATAHNADFALQGLPASWVSTTGNSDTVDLEITDGETLMILPDCMIRGDYSDGGVDGPSQVITYTFTCPHMYPTLSTP